MAQEIFDAVEELSDKLKVAPLKEGEVATFRLKKAGIKDPSREQPSCPEVVQFPGQERIVDPHHKGGRKNKVIGTFIEKIVPGPGNTGKPYYKPIIFYRGELKITHNEPALYEYVMRMKANESNRFRRQMGLKKEHPQSFYLVGTKEISDVMHAADLKFFAEKMIRESKFDDLKAIAVVLNANPDPRLKVNSYRDGVNFDPEKIKYELIGLAQRYSRQVISASPDDKSKLKVQIYDALAYSILIFEKEAFWLDTENGTEEVMKPEADVNKVDSLINYYMSDDGRKSYVDFAKTLKKALQIS